MDLFLIKRYDGKLSSTDDTSFREEKLKQRLQKNIELKKKLKQQQNVDQQKVQPEETVAEDSKADDEIEEPDSTPAAPQFDSLPGDNTDFQILGEDKKGKRHSVKRTLPSWLEYPAIISNDLAIEGEPIADLPFISDQLKQNLKDMKVKHLFPVQRSVIPWLLNAHRAPAPFRPRDLCVSAPTGSGKTIAFALPIVEDLKSRVVPRIRALVVLPVRELAQQVHSVFQNLCKGTGLICGLLSAKRTLAEEQQLLVKEFDGNYYSRVDIVIATAGRLVEHLHSTKGFCLADLKYLVIDEADRVMDQIQNDWLYHLGKHVKQASEQLFMGNNHLSVHHLENTKCAHKLLFSATLSSDPEKLERMKLFRPKLFTSLVVESAGTKEDTDKVNDEEEATDDEPLKAKGEFVGKFTIPAQLKERICNTIMASKPLTLYSLIQEKKWKRFLCFVNNAEMGSRLTMVLRNLSDNGLLIEDMSSKRTKADRDAVINKFKLGRIQGVICTDAMARGLDYDNIDVVVCYDCPRHVKTYIHRVGRTARAGKEGMSVILLTPEEEDRFKGLLKDMGKTTMEELASDGVVEQQCAAKYATVLEDLQKHLLKEKKLHKIKKMREENSAPVSAATNRNSILGMLQQQMQNKTGIKDISAMLDNQQRKRKAGKPEEKINKKKIKSE